MEETGAAQDAVLKRLDEISAKVAGLDEIKAAVAGLDEIKAEVKGIGELKAEVKGLGLQIAGLKTQVAGLDSRVAGLETKWDDTGERLDVMQSLVHALALQGVKHLEDLDKLKRKRSRK